MKNQIKPASYLLLIWILIAFCLSGCSPDSITAKIVTESQAVEDSTLADTLAAGLADPNVENVKETAKEPEKAQEARLTAPKPKIEPEIQKKIKEKPKEKVDIVMTVKDEQDIEKISKLIKESSGEVKGEFKVGGVISAEIEAEKLEKISEDDSIEEIATEKEYFAFLNESIPQINIDTIAWAGNYTGKGVKIAILDTGIDTDHEMFGNRTVLSKSFNSEGINDLNGHGSHCAGIAAGNGQYKGAAPGAYLLNAKVLTSRGSGTTSSIIAGINWALDPDGNSSTDDGADIISMSFGGSLTDLDGPLASAIKEAIDEGIVFVAASGNCRQGCGGFFGVTMPGSMPEVITVGAVNENNKIASFSSGDTFSNYIKPDVVAPGVNIISATKNNGYKSASGTSMSTPMVAGLIALMLEKENLTHAQIKKKLENTATDLGDSGKDDAYGSGLVNVSGVFASEVVEVNETEEPEENITPSTDSKIITEDIGEFRFLIKRNISNNVSQAVSHNKAIYALAEKRIYVEEAIFDNADTFAKYLYITVPMGSKEKTKFVQNNNTYVKYEKKLFWFTGKSLYSVKTLNISLNNTALLSFLDKYSAKTGNDIGSDFEGNIQQLKQIDKQILQQKHTQAIQRINISGKNISFEEQWGGSTSDDAKTLTFGDSNSEYYRTQGAANWYYIETDERGILEFGIEDIDSGDDLDLYLYDYQVNYFDSSTRSGNRDEKITDTKNTDTTWAYYLKVVPYKISGLYAEANIYSSKSCTAKWLDEWDCRSWNNLYRKFQESDCDIEWRHYEDCDDDDDPENWNCSSSSTAKNEQKDWYCDSSADRCDYDVETEYDYCDSAEKCDDGDCVDKECSDYSNNGGSCSWSDYYSSNTYCVGDIDGNPAECEKFGNVYCWDYLDTCTSEEYCNDPWNGPAACFEYECEVDSVSWDKTSAEKDSSVGITVEGDHCDSSDYVTFNVYENDCWGILEANTTSMANETNFSSQGICNDEVNTQPSKAYFSNNKAKSTWTAEWQSDATGDPEYYVYAYLQGDTDEDTRSGNKLTVSCMDNDRDGHKSDACGGDDCNDNDATIYPGNTEICDQKDNDCDNSIDEDGACDCHLSSVSWDKTSAPMGSTVGFKVYGDSNCNGKYALMQVWEYDWSSGDDPVQNNPSNPRFSNGIAVGSWITEWQPDAGTDPEYYLKASQGSSTVKSSNRLTVGCKDGDGDGYNSAICGGNDCNDQDSNIHPGHAESCNGADDDCDTQIDETFDFQTDNNNCGACNVRCKDLGQYYECQNSVCVRQRVCGDNICEGPETSANCAQDCYGDLKVTAITAPSEVDQNEYVTIKATIENKGTYTDQLNIEAGIVPDYWRGTIFSMEENLSTQAVGFTTKCCQGNQYYDAKTITLDAGSSEEVTFKVYAPKTTSTDACGQPSSGYYSAWDTSHEVMVGIYPACGQSYTHSLTKNIKIKDTPCNFDSDCGPGATCQYDSENPSNSICIPNPCEVQCNSDNLYFCEGSSLYMCKMNLTNGCYQRTPVQTCPVGYECVDGKSSCQKVVIETHLSIEESTGAVVYKQPGDILTVNLKHKKNENIQLEYDHSDFTLDKSSCPGDSFTITKDMACKFKVEDTGWGEYEFKIKNGNKRIVDIIYYPDLLFLTNKDKLLERFSGNTVEVSDLLSKAYSQAASKDRQAIIYDLADYIPDHPWEKLSDYKETPRIQAMTDNSYSFDVGQFIREKCEYCEGIIILGGDFVVPYYRRDVSILDWKLFYSDTRVDNVYSDIPYIKRTEKYFSELDDLFKFKGKYNSKKVKLILPDSFSSDMSSQITKFKDVINKSYQPKIEEIKSKDVYCKDQKLFEKYDGATLIVIGTEQNNRAYQCMPFVAGYENRDSAFIEINPWDGREYSIIINTDDPHVLEALTETIDSGAYVKLKSKNWWYLEISLTATSYVFLLGEAITGIPLDTGSDIIDSINDCWVIKDSLSCKVSVPMIAIPWVPGKPFKVAFKAFRKSVGKPVEMFLTKYGDEAFKFLKLLYKKGKLNRIQDMFRLAGDRWDEVYKLLKTELGDKILLKWSDKAREGLGKIVQKLNNADVEKLAKEYGDDSVAAVSERYARETIDWSKDKITKTIKTKGTGNLIVEDNNLVAFQYLQDEFFKDTNYKVGKIYDFGNTEYYFKPNKVFRPNDLRDQTFSNLKEKAIYNVESILNAKDTRYIVPKTKTTREIGIGLPTEDSKKVKGLLLEAVDGKTFEDGFQKWRASKGISNLDYADYLAASDGLSKSTKEALYGKTFSDMVFGEMDRHPRNMLITAEGKVSYIDYGGSLGLSRSNDPIFLKDANFETVFKDTDFTDMDSRPIAGSLAKLWNSGDEGKKEALKIMKPEVDKFRTLTREQFEAATMFEDMTKSDRDHFRIIADKLFGKGSNTGRVQSLIDDFDKYAKQYGVK